MQNRQLGTNGARSNPRAICVAVHCWWIWYDNGQIRRDISHIVSSLFSALFSASNLSFINSADDFGRFLCGGPWPRSSYPKTKNRAMWRNENAWETHTKCDMPIIIDGEYEKYGKALKLATREMRFFALQFTSDRLNNVIVWFGNRWHHTQRT